jgi:polyisoprenyl-phosphate glycosyltransferase
MKTISIIIPCHNESENIPFAVNQIQKTVDQIQNYEWELIFVDDGSTDATILELQKALETEKRIKIVELSRNFGKEVALSAGISLCTGDACIVIDADMQYPIDKLPEFIASWESGNDVVIGIRDQKNTNNIVEKIGSNMFYWIMDRISDTTILKGALDYRLLDRKVIDEYNKFTEHGRMMRSLVDWLGFRRDFVHYNEQPRLYGTPSYSFVKRVKLALNTFVSHSYFPMKVVGYLGVLISATTFPIGLVIITNKYMFKDPFGWNFTGSFSAGLLNIFLTGIILTSLGLIANYIANIQNEVTNRPLFVIRKIY